MRHLRKLILATIAATLFMILMITAASANRLRLSSKNIRIVWTEMILTNGAGGEGLITCPVTLEGSIHSATVSKVIGSLVGHINRATIAEASCRGGRATISQASLPWHTTFEGFTGTLPRIASMILSLQGVNFVIEVFGVVCGYGRPEENSRGIANVEAGGTITSLNSDTSIAIAKLTGGILCPSTGGFSGTASVMVQGTTTRLTVRLI